jgi:hypothetical protein
LVYEEVQRAEVAERRGDVNGLYNITKKLSSRGFRKYKSVRNNKGDILVTQVEQ